MSEPPKTCYTPDKIEAGLDECGYGSLAGPVVGSVVIWPRDITLDTEEEVFLYSKITDSKKLSRSMRARLSIFIMSKCIDFSVVFIDNNIIDEINVLQARNKAFRTAISRLCVKPELLLVDGTASINSDIPEILIIEGDRKFMSISAASIIGKHLHDDYMEKIDIETGQIYEWGSNMGYGSSKHVTAMKIHGLSKYHRKTYNICKQIHVKNEFLRTLADWDHPTDDSLPARGTSELVDDT